MRLRFFLYPICAFLLGSCAYQGTIVQKDATPLPFTYSYGLEGSYAFLLRDNTGTVRRQIVTPEVYHAYAVGDYFNDLQPAPLHDGKSFDGKTVLTAMMSKVSPARHTAHARKPAQTRQLAKAAKAKQPQVRLAKQSRPPAVQSRPPAVVQPTSRTAATVEPPRKAVPVTPRPVALPPQRLRARSMWHTDFAYVSVQRCR